MKIQNPGLVGLPGSIYGGGLVLPYQGKTPVIGEDVFLAPGASVIGSVKLGDRVSIWFGSVLRGDIAPIEVGEGSNIQDNSVLHVGDDDPCIVGRNVVVGHRATLHGCRVEDNCMIGIGAIVLSGAVVGEGSVVGAGALITQGTIIPPRSLVLGAPAKIKRPLTEEEIAHHGAFGPKYVRVAAGYKDLFD
jgi:carbonic anhydrase/acetyltransferase-like protein (isoleucine patch superfamily)